MERLCVVQSFACASFVAAIVFWAHCLVSPLQGALEERPRAPSCILKDVAPQPSFLFYML